MGKRFIDTGIFRKPAIRAMKAPYKALFIYLLCECDHAGVWDEEIDVAAMRLGMDIDKETALAELGSSVKAIGSKWYLTDFVAYQYGELNPANRVHASVISRLQSLGICQTDDQKNKPLASPLEGAKDKDKDKDKDSSSGKERARSMADRIAAFEAEVKSVNAQKRILSDSELVKFIAYWTQAGANDRKFHAEKQQTFGIQGRLITWGGRVKESASVKPEHTGARRNLETDWDKA